MTLRIALMRGTYASISTQDLNYMIITGQRHLKYR